MRRLILVAIVVFISAFPTIASADDERHDAVTCYYKDANGSPVGKVQESCSGSINIILHSGKSWDDVAEVNCNSYPCTLGSLCSSGTESVIVDGICSCATSAVLNEIVIHRVTYDLPYEPIYLPGCIP